MGKTLFQSSENFRRLWNDDHVFLDWLCVYRFYRQYFPRNPERSTWMELQREDLHPCYSDSSILHRPNTIPKVACTLFWGFKYSNSYYFCDRSVLHFQ